MRRKAQRSYGETCYCLDISVPPSKDCMMGKLRTKHYTVSMSTFETSNVLLSCIIYWMLMVCVKWCIICIKCSWIDALVISLLLELSSFNHHTRYMDGRHATVPWHFIQLYIWELKSQGDIVSQTYGVIWWWNNFSPKKSCTGTLYMYM